MCIGQRSILDIMSQEPGTLLSGIILFGSCSSLARLIWLTREPQDPLSSTTPVMDSQARTVSPFLAFCMGTGGKTCVFMFVWEHHAHLALSSVLPWICDT